jgi:hypothetical protein
MPLAERAVDLALFHRNRCFARLGSPPSRCDLDGGEMRRVLRLSDFAAAENQVGCVTGRCLRSGLWQRV